MTEVEIAYDSSTSVSYAADLVATSATLSFVAPDGTEIEAPSVTLPTVSTTTTSGTTATILTLVAVTGITPGTILQVTSDGVTYRCEAAIVDATAKTVALVTGLPVVPDSGSAVKGVLLTASIAAPGASRIGGNYRLAWTYSDGTTTRTAGVAASVVRWPWVSPCSASDVRDAVVELGAGNRTNQWCADVAQRVSDAIRGRILQTGRRPYLYLSSLIFQSAARAGIRYELSQRGIAFGGQIYEAQRELRFAFDDAIAAAVTSIMAYDADADGTIDTDEARPMHFTIQAQR